MTRRATQGAVVFLTTGLSHTAGGPFFSVSGLAASLHLSTAWHPQVIGTYTDAASWLRDRGQWTECGLSAQPHAGMASARWLAAACRTALQGWMRQGHAAIMHVSGLWDAASIAGSIVAAHMSVPYVISPRGMLEPWALRSKAFKKRAALLAWQRVLLANATMIHATSDQEYRSIRAAGFHNPVCIVPNGVDLPLSVMNRHADDGAGRNRRCVFLSRIHPKKGLLLLIKAWARVRPRGWTLEIAGFTEDRGHEAAARQLVADLNLSDVRFVGERQGDEKWAFLHDADLFVLPSYSENFGIVVAEALACGVPVIATTGTPWQVLAERGLGWWVDPSESALAEALSQAMAESPQVLAARGLQGRSYAATQFGWEQIAHRISAAYCWASGIGPVTADIALA